MLSRRGPLLSPRGPSLSRRGQLCLAAGVGLVTGLAGCRSQPAAPPIPLEPDELAVNRAADAARKLRADALALAEARPELAVLLGRIVAVHEQHLAALGTPVPDTSASGAPVSGAPDPVGSAPTSTPGPTPTPPRLIQAEVAAAQTALRDGEAAAPAFAVLLCRIAAARIVNADLLSAATNRNPPGILRPAAATPSAASSAPTNSAASSATADPAATPTADPANQSDLSEPSTPAEVAVNRLLAGEHAAVFAYPLVIARAGGRRSLASELWQAHRTERDELSVRLLTAGLQPAVAEPAYDVGTLPATPARAAALAARVERGLAALAADLLAVGTAADDDRKLGADQLVLAARRMAGWTGKPTAFPGLITRSTPAVTASPAAYTPPDAGPPSSSPNASTP
jgi:hypothetical protein